MFDIGIGEILIVAVIGLLVFGPERLPRAAADAAKWLKQIRSMASGARKDLADSAGIDLSETVDTVKSLQEFHPRTAGREPVEGRPRTTASPPPVTTRRAGSTGLRPRRDLGVYASARRGRCPSDIPASPRGRRPRVSAICGSATEAGASGG